MNIYQALLPIIAIATLASPAVARDDDTAEVPDDKAHGTVVTGLGAVPDYEGARTMRIIPLAGGIVRFGDRYIALDGLSARANILASDRFEIGPVAHLTLGRRARIANAAVASLGRIDDAYEVGGFAATTLRLDDASRLRLAVQAVHDVSQVHNGWVLTASAGYARRLGDKWRVTADASVSGASDDYARRYFSVSPIGATASGLNAFTARGGIKDVGLSLGLTHQVSQRWSITGFGGYKRLLGDFAASPVVSRVGDANQFSGGIGVGFSF